MANQAREQVRRPGSELEGKAVLWGNEGRERGRGFLRTHSTVIPSLTPGCLNRAGKANQPIKQWTQQLGQTLPKLQRPALVSPAPPWRK